MKDSGLNPTRDLTTRPCFPTISSIYSPQEAKHMSRHSFKRQLVHMSVCVYRDMKHAGSLESKKDT